MGMLADLIEDEIWAWYARVKRDAGCGHIDCGYQECNDCPVRGLKGGDEVSNLVDDLFYAIKTKLGGSSEGQSS